jgi:hypothetical protein
VDVEVAAKDHASPQARIKQWEKIRHGAKYGLVRVTEHSVQAHGDQRLAITEVHLGNS